LPPDTAFGADPATQVVSAVAVPFVTSGDSARLVPARIVVSHSLSSLVALRRGVALSFLVAVLVTGLIALLLASWLSTRISRPLTALAAKTADVDMDRLDVAFDSDRSDETGALTRLLGAMTERPRPRPHRRPRPAAHPRQPHRERPRQPRGTSRPRHRHDRGKRASRRACHRRGHRQRHDQRRAESRLRRLLHDQARRDRPRSVDRATSGARCERSVARGDAARRGQHVHCRTAGRAHVSAILVVDDVPAMAEQYAYDLKRVGGYDALVAHSGRAALDLLEREAVDCVILDLEMPGMDG